MLTPTLIAIGLVGYMLLIAAVGVREVRIRKRIKAERREAIRLEEYEIGVDLMHDEQGIQQAGQEIG